MKSNSCVSFFVVRTQAQKLISCGRDERTSSSSLKPPAVTISLLSGALVISYSDRNLARAALFSGKAMKFDQFLGSGTSRFSITRRIGLLVLLRLFRVVSFIECSQYLSKTKSIRSQNFPICRIARRKVSDRSPKVRLSLGLPNETTNA